MFSIAGKFSNVCCKVYKRNGVVFRWFFPGVFRELSRESVVFTEVWRRSREKLGGFVKCRQRSCLLNCNREVTCIWQEAEFIQEWRRSSVVTSLVWACCEFLSGITAFVWNKYSGCVFRHPCVLFRHKLPPLKTFEPVTHNNQYSSLSLI